MAGAGWQVAGALAGALWTAFPSAASAGDLAKGKVLYEKSCAFCHGMAGKGDGPAGAALKPPPTDFTNPDIQRSTTPQALAHVIENGKPGTAMVAFKNTLNAEQVEDVLAYLMSLQATR